MIFLTPPPIALTTGEPAGIGAEVSIRAALAWQASVEPSKPKAPLVLLGDFDFLQSVAAQMSVDATLRQFDASNPFESKVLDVLHIPLSVPVQAGVLNVANAQYVLNLLDAAIDGIVAQRFSAMVTAPVQKSTINDSGIAFTGHTEYLAHKTATEQVVMMLAGGGMRVALATTHLPLSQVPAAITTASLTRTIEIILADLQHKFGIAQPRLLVTGLNPHAGEDGHMGTEEITTITPVIKAFQQKGFDVRGPYPADTLFQPHYLKDADAVLAMYHDQGLPVLKYASFGHGINITLGLPIIRTSVDHGTALNLAGKNQADAGSMLAAIGSAAEMICVRD